MTSQQQQQQQDKLKQLGNTLVQKEEYEQAAKFYDRALELDSTSEAAAAIFSNRSLCFLNMKKFKDALADAERAISLRPTWHRGYQRAAAACEKLDKHEEGLKHLEKCFELDEASKDDCALKKLKETFETNIIKNKAPSMTQDELKQIGNTFVKNQQYESAIAVYTLAIEKDAFCDAAVPILSNRSMAYFKIGKYKEAYEDGGFCCGIKPDWAKGFMRRGVAAEKLENWQIALESYDEYLKLDPQDESNVKNSRTAVVAILAEKTKQEQQEQLRREELKQELESIKDPAEQLARCLQEIASASATFDVERTKIAMSQQCKPRIDTPFWREKFPLSSSTASFRPEALESAKRNITETPGTLTVAVVAEMLIFVFGDKEKFSKIPISRQVQYLDLILDAVDEQDFVSSGGMTMELRRICWYDPTSTQFSSIRKDLVITLFNRIDAARKLFCPRSASNKDFASFMLLSMCANYDPRLFRPTTDAAAKKLHISDKSKDISTQDLYECICTALHHGADPNRFDLHLNNLSSLGGAIVNLRSLRVLELFLRHKADVNVFTEVKEVLAGHNERKEIMVMRSPLCMAFLVRRIDLARALFAHGARLPSEKLPDFVLKLLPPSNHQLVKPMYSPLLQSAFSQLHIADVAVITHEYLQLLFEVNEKQGLSFVYPSATRASFRTPMTQAIDHGVQASMIETMIKLKPELLRLCGIPPPLDMNMGIYPLGCILIAAEQGGNVSYLTSLAQLFKKYGVNFRNDIAQGSLKPSAKASSKFTGSQLMESMLRGTKRDPSCLLAVKTAFTEK